MKSEVFYICLFIGVLCLPGSARGQACDSVLTGSGQIQNEGYPAKYPSFFDCTWTIQAEDTDTVNLQFNDFNIEPGETCEFDSLEITVKAGSRKFCGDKISDVSANGKLSLKGTVVLRMRSDDSVQLRGIDLNYEVIPDPDPPTTTVPTTTSAPTTTTMAPTAATVSSVTCDDEPCQNGGECTMDGKEVFCFCLNGFEGNFCEIDIDECASSPCENGGSCIDGANAWKCECVPGYIGETCGIDFDECRASPCKNGGTCEDKVNAFNCICAEGWTDWDCATEIDECDPNPCLNYGVCDDYVGYYTCICHPNFTGKNCETSVEEPADVPVPEEDEPPIQPDSVSDDGEKEPDDLIGRGSSVPSGEENSLVSPEEENSLESPEEENSLKSPEEENSLESPEEENSLESLSSLATTTAPESTSHYQTSKPGVASKPDTATQNPSNASESNQDPNEGGHEGSLDGNDNKTNVGSGAGDSGHQAHSAPIEAIVGGILGALGLLGAVAAAVYYYKTMNSNSKVHASEKSVRVEKGDFDRAQASKEERESLKSPSCHRKTTETKRKRFTKKRKSARRAEVKDLVSSSVDSGITSRPTTSHQDEIKQATTQSQPPALKKNPELEKSIRDNLTPPFSSCPMVKEVKPLDLKSDSKQRTVKSKMKKRHKSKKTTKTAQLDAAVNSSSEILRDLHRTLIRPTPLPNIVTPRESTFHDEIIEVYPENQAELKLFSFRTKPANVLSNPCGRFSKSFAASSTHSPSAAESSVLAHTNASFVSDFPPSFTLGSEKLSEEQRPRKRKIAHRTRGPRPKSAATEHRPSSVNRYLPNIPEHLQSPNKDLPSTQRGRNLDEPHYIFSSHLSESSKSRPVFFSQISNRNLSSQQQTRSPTIENYSQNTESCARELKSRWMGESYQQHSPISPQSPSPSGRIGLSDWANTSRSRHQPEELPDMHVRNLGHRHSGTGVDIPMRTSSTRRNTSSRQSSPRRGTSTSISSADDLLESRDPKSLDKTSFSVVTYTPRPRSLAPLRHHGYLPEPLTGEQTNWSRKRFQQPLDQDDFPTNIKPK